MLLLLIPLMVEASAVSTLETSDSQQLELFASIYDLILDAASVPSLLIADNRPHHNWFSGTPPKLRLCPMLMCIENDPGFSPYDRLQHTIQRVTENSTAELWGLEKGMKVLGINGTLTQGKSNKDLRVMYKQNPFQCSLLCTTDEIYKHYMDTNQEISYEVAEEYIVTTGPQQPMGMNWISVDPIWQDQAHVLAYYKTEQCKEPGSCRQGYACPFYHNNKDRRRPPGNYYNYGSKACLWTMWAGLWRGDDSCESGDNCLYCHTRTEQQFHPEIYKSMTCDYMRQHGYCPPFFPFAHVEGER